MNAIPPEGFKRYVNQWCVGYTESGASVLRQVVELENGKCETWYETFPDHESWVSWWSDTCPPLAVVNQEANDGR